MLLQVQSVSFVLWLHEAQLQSNLLESGKKGDKFKPNNIFTNWILS